MEDREREESTMSQAGAAAAPLGPSELERLFEEHHQRILQAAFRVTGSGEDAQDVLQTIFLRLARRSDPPDLERAPAAYFHRAAVNAALDLVRARRSRASEPLEPASPADRDGAPNPERVAASRQLGQRLREALATLSRPAAEAFVLRYIEGLGNSEVARVLGLSQNAVGVSLHRTRIRLQALLASSPEGGTP